MSKSTDTNEQWQKILELLLADRPEILNRTTEESIADFNRLSNKIAEQMPYKSIEEFERAMRGEHYGLVRY